MGIDDTLLLDDLLESNDHEPQKKDFDKFLMKKQDAPTKSDFFSKKTFSEKSSYAKSN